MPFWSRRRTSPREQGWRAFAARLELEDASDESERLRRWLDLDDGPMGPVYRLRRPGQPTLYLFDQAVERRGPTGVARQERSLVVVRAAGEVAVHAWRALARRNAVLESLEASRTGTGRLSWPDDPDFDAEVSVFARDPEAVRAVLPPAVRGVLRRAVAGRAVSPTVVVGRRTLVLRTEGGEPVPFAALEELTADLLTLYALVADVAAG